MRSVTLASLFAFSALLSGALGCGQSKEDAALARARNRPKPGFVRILNLSGDKATLLSKGRPVNPDVENGESGRLNPEGVGKRRVVVSKKGQEEEVEVDLASEMGHTIIVLPNKNAIIGGEPRKPVAGKNLHVVFVGPDGTVLENAKPVEMGSASGKLSLDPKEHGYEVASGKVSLLGKTFEVKPNFAYTILVVQSGSSTKPYFMLNTPDDVPAATGTSSS